MSAISGIGSGASAWQAAAIGRASQMRDKMFAKVDGDGNGSVDKSELQGMLDHISSKTGTSAGSADELLGKMDSDGNGSLSQSELQKGMESLRPASTMAFAQQRTEAPSDDGAFAALDTDGDGSLSRSEFDAARPDGAPPAGGAPHGARGGGKSADTGSMSSATIDPLDTNEDGVVSAQERLIGKLEELVKAVQASASGEVDGSDASGGLRSQGNEASGSSTDAQALASFAEKVTQKYLDWASQSSRQSVSATA